MVSPQTPVFLFAGNDSYSKEQAIKKLASSFFDTSSRELDYKVFDGGDADIRDILTNVSTTPFSASRRLVVIRNFGKLSAEDIARLTVYMENPMKSTCLVLDAEDDSVVSDYPKISRNVAVGRFSLTLNDSQFQARSKEVLASLGGGKDIRQDAVRTLSELCGNDFGLVSQELRKLSSFVGDRKEIETGDVEEVVGKSANASVFDLTDAIEAGDLKKALSIISELLLSGKKHYEVVGLLCWQMKRFFRGRMLLEKKIPDARIAGELKVNRRYYDRFFRYVKSSGLAQIESRIRILLEADLDMKRAKYDPGITLEFAVIKLCLGRLPN